MIAACTGGMSALRAVVKLEPAGGEGDKVFPPTHLDGKYASEKRAIDGRNDVETVLLDSVQSQANRLEDALLTSVRAGDIRIPLLQVNIPGHQTITSLSAPHRVHDAIFLRLPIQRYALSRFRDWQGHGRGAGVECDWHVQDLSNCSAVWLYGIRKAAQESTALNSPAH